MRFRLGLLAVPLALVCCGGKVAGDGSRDASPSDGAPATGCGADLANDPTNCGWCGHDCLGAECKNQVCAPSALASDVESPVALAVDDANAYFTTAGPGSVQRVRKDGGGGLTYSSGFEVAPAIGVDGFDVYWIVSGRGALDPNSRYRAKGLDGPEGTIPGSDSSITLATCDGDVWVASSTNELLRFGLKSGVRAQFAIDANPIDLSCGSSGVFWLDRGRGTKPDGAGRVMRFSGKTLVDGTVLASFVTSPQRLVTDADSVYFTSGRYSGLVQSVPVKGGSTTTLVSGQLDPRGIAVDDRYAYWVTFGQLPAEGTVMRTDKRLGGPPQFLAFGQRRPLAIAVDDTFVYWTSQGEPGKANGGVHRVPK